MYGSAPQPRASYPRSARATMNSTEESRIHWTPESQASSMSFFGSASEGSEYEDTPPSRHYTQQKKTRNGGVKQPADSGSYPPPIYHLEPKFTPHSAYQVGVTLNVPPPPINEKLKGPWQRSEDELLVFWAIRLGTTRWVDVAAKVVSRSSKQVRERWTNQLSPDIDHSPFRPEEDDLIIKMQAEMEGNHWCEVAKCLPGRPENTIKNRFNSTIVQRKRAEMLGGYYVDNRRFVQNRTLPPLPFSQTPLPGHFPRDPSLSYGSGGVGWSSGLLSPSLGQKRRLLGDQDVVDSTNTTTADEQRGKRVRKLDFLDLHRQSAPDAGESGHPAHRDFNSYPPTPITPGFAGHHHFGQGHPSSLPLPPIPSNFPSAGSAPASWQLSRTSTGMNPQWSQSEGGYPTTSPSYYAQRGSEGHRDAANGFGGVGGTHGSTSYGYSGPSLSSASSLGLGTSTHEEAAPPMQQSMSAHHYAAYEAGYRASVMGTTGGRSIDSPSWPPTSVGATNAQSVSGSHQASVSSASSSSSSSHDSEASSHEGIREGAAGSSMTLQAQASPPTFFTSHASPTAHHEHRSAGARVVEEAPAVKWTSMGSRARSDRIGYGIGLEGGEVSSRYLAAAE